MGGLLFQEKKNRCSQKRADDLPCYIHDFPSAVIEAKAGYKAAGAGLRQAREYAGILGLKFVYAAHGHGIIEFDFIPGREQEITSFPTPDKLWTRLRAWQSLDAQTATRFLAPFHLLSKKTQRYYQEIAIKHAVQEILQGKRRILLTMARSLFLSAMTAIKLKIVRRSKAERCILPFTKQSPGTNAFQGFTGITPKIFSI